MTTYNRFQQGLIGVLGSALLVTSIDRSTPLNTREKGALIGGGPGAGVLAHSSVAGQTPRSAAH